MCNKADISTDSSNVVRTGKSGCMHRRNSMRELLSRPDIPALYQLFLILNKYTTAPPHRSSTTSITAKGITFSADLLSTRWFCPNSTAVSSVGSKTVEPADWAALLPETFEAAEPDMSDMRGASETVEGDARPTVLLLPAVFDNEVGAAGALSASSQIM